MSRDHRKLRVFAAADELVMTVYRCTSRFPAAEKYGLQIQIRRAAVSAVVNIVEGAARRSKHEYLHFLNVAAGSASEARYLVDLSSRLGLIDSAENESIQRGYTDLVAGLVALINSLSPKP